MAGYNPHLPEVTGMSLQPYRHRPPIARIRLLPRACVGALLAMMLVTGVHAQDSAHDAEKKLQRTRGELRSVARERQRLQGNRDAASRRLRDADMKVAQSSRAVAETEAAIRSQQQALQQLQQQRAALEANLGGQRRQLAALLRDAYQQGGHAPLKLLLAQDSVAEANRKLAYHRYLQRDRARSIARLATDLQGVADTERQIAARGQELEQARERQRQQVAALAADRRQHALAVDELDKRYRDSSDREKALGQDVRALERVLASLRAAARAEAERRAAALHAGDRQATTGTTAKVPPRVVANAPAPKVGGLGWPLSGSLLARYGGRLPDGRTSNGVLIGAAAGSNITAVADGTVVFSDWMTGYGMILIVDHGNGYMSLYAHNETLLRDAGARVRRGEVVARVGNSGGQGVPALYFELRHNGRPVNPSTWLQQRQ